MKLFSIILATLMLALSSMPCSDGQNLEDQHQDEISADHNHQNDSDDTCPITCICNCCGIAITYQPIQTFNLSLHNPISTEIVSAYQSIYRFDYLSSIWQPPQV